jgi:RNA polymerase sigma factor (sigma-70 family)
MYNKENVKERVLTLTKEYFNIIYEKYYDIVKRVVISRISTNNSDDISGCINDVFIAAYTDTKNDLQNHPNIAGWLVRTADNYVKRYNKTNAIRFKRSAELEDDLSNDDFAKSSDENIVYNDMIKSGVLEKIFDTFTPAERDFYNLKYIQKLSDKEISDTTGMNPTLVRVKNHRLKLKVKKMITEL